MNIMFKSNELATKCDTNYKSNGKLYSQETHKDFQLNVLNKSQLTVQSLPGFQKASFVYVQMWLMFPLLFITNI
jgi:hypothetical protein